MLRASRSIASMFVFHCVLGGVTGCGSTQEAGAGSAGARSDAMQAAPVDMFGCSRDDECVGVPREGCRNGVLIAVHRDHAQAYHDLFASRPAAGCPLVLIQDRREARCNTERGRCEMVYPKRHTPG